VTCKTICAKCKHCEIQGEGNGWYNYLCAHPEFARIPEQDPVTGKSGFAEKNDLGRIVFTENKFPYCREINHGNCELFEKKWGWFGLLPIIAGIAGCAVGRDEAIGTPPKISAETDDPVSFIRDGRHWIKFTSIAHDSECPCFSE